MPTTMVLRFRDLVRETIPEHRGMIDGNGYVWWAWWNKPDEKIPRHLFSDFQTTIDNAGELWVYLADSGTRTLYKARLVEVDAAATEKPKACSEPDKAPAYYRDQFYKVWLKFTTIEDASAEELREWSYDEVEEFIDDPTSSAFQDKRVFSLDEMLLRRHRTIYFVKPYEAGHRDHFVELLPPYLPAAFIPTAIHGRSDYVIHLSDLHFGPDHGFSLTNEGANKSLATLIIETLRREHADDPPAAVVISGDLTWQGTKEQFDIATDFITTIKSAFGLDISQFVIVPGNHDIQWSDQTHDYDPSKPVGRAPDEAQQNYAEFFKAVFGVAPNPFLSMGRRVILSNFVSIDILGLNSSRLEQRHFAGYGFISLEQLEEAARQMGWDSGEARTYYRLVVVHHHLVPVTPKEEITTFDRIYSLTLDAGQITYRAIEVGADLLIHGHMHQPFVSSLLRGSNQADFPSEHSLGVHGAGSAGVKRDHLGDIGKNSFSIHRFDLDGVQTEIYSWSDNIAGFESAWSCYFARASAGGLQVASPVDES